MKQVNWSQLELTVMSASPGELKTALEKGEAAVVSRLWVGVHHEECLDYGLE